MIEALDVWKRHGALEVLKGVHLSVGRGEVAAIIGPSGSGKSTFLRCLNGLERFDRGAVRLGGLSLDGADRGAHRGAVLKQVRRRVGM
ncbi:MAG: ATP-binding cassette domain-containing protein, partial [Thermoleophilia bacterium]|nr:ATP-binding cassette domain-containing protein [Thermoleophilia bacterium]